MIEGTWQFYSYFLFLTFHLHKQSSMFQNLGKIKIEIIKILHLYVHYSSSEQISDRKYLLFPVVWLPSVPIPERTELC